MNVTRTRPWVVVSNYPAWPSPYFAELHRHAPPELGLDFTPDLAAVARRRGPAGVLNLHRLKRLYRTADGRRTPAAAERFLARLAALRAAGWNVVWTVHNLLPVDGGQPGPADHQAANGVLAMADAVIAHTRADAAHLSSLTRAPVVVAGWAGLTPGPAGNAVPEQVTRLSQHITNTPGSVLLVGNLTAYKGLPALVRIFTAHTRTMHLFLAGPCREETVANATAAEARHADGRVHLYVGRIPPQHLGALYQAADAALCPYRVDGPWSFFTRVLHPSSVATAVTLGAPVVAPDLPAVREITTGHPRHLYPPAAGPGAVLAAVEAAPRPAAPRPPAGEIPRWQELTAAYLHLACHLANTGSDAP